MLDNRVRSRRESCGLSQLALADRAKLTRQSVGAIEAGRAIPGVDVALRIARALECPVEELFGSQDDATWFPTEPTGANITGRVALAHIRGRWVSHALSGDDNRISADGIVGAVHVGSVDVQPLRPTTASRNNVILMGCATGLGLLADRLNTHAAGRFLWLGGSSTRALDALGRGHTHIAGVHLVDADTGEANVADVRLLASREAIVLITLAHWEVGLVLRQADVGKIRGARDLVRPGLRLVTREPGAGTQRVLERHVTALDLALHSHIEVGAHLDVARAVAMGAADTGVATQDVAMAFGLAFVPLAEERYDLALPVESLSDPRIARLCDVLVSAHYRRELSAIGYTVRCSGDRVAEVEAA